MKLDVPLRREQRTLRWLVVGSILVALALFLAVPQTGLAADSSYGTQEAEDSEATFDEDDATSDAVQGASDALAAAKEKFNIKLYLDFMYEFALGDADEEEEASGLRDPEHGSFSSNHTYLLITANPTERMRIGFDITFNEYYEIEYALTPKLFVKGGLIYLPFGDFRYHAIYGGKVYSIDNDLFPNWFTDFGLAMEHEVLDLSFLNLRYGAFVSNGFQEGVDGDVNMNAIGFTQDNNEEKAYGGRVKATLFGGYTLTLSGMLDRWSDDGQASLRLLALEGATTRGLLDLPLLNRLNLKLGYLDNRIENDNATDPDFEDYNAFGTHAELSLKVTDWLRFAYRMGEVDPNEDVDNELDQRNYNISAMVGVNKHLHFFTMYQRNEEKYGDEIDNDYVMIKAIAEF